MHRTGERVPWSERQSLEQNQLQRVGADAKSSEGLACTRSRCHVYTAWRKNDHQETIVAVALSYDHSGYVLCTAVTDAVTNDGL